jgi:hypothetical protein
MSGLPLLRIEGEDKHTRLVQRRTCTSPSLMPEVLGAEVQVGVAAFGQHGQG